MHCIECVHSNFIFYWDILQVFYSFLHTFLYTNSFVFCLPFQYWQLIQNRNCDSAFKNSKPGLGLNQMKVISD